MSTALVEVEIARFLASSTPEVLCLRGKWGVGKTYSWNAFLQRAKEQRDIKLEKYAYVSLFGLDTLNRVRLEIFENSVETKNIGIEPSIESLKSNTTAVAKQLGRRSLWLLQTMPIAKGYLPVAESLSYLWVSRTVICIDDLERKGSSLPMRDVLGLISQLRDKKHCKIILIFNDDALDDNEKKEFALYSEKVVDISLEFAPDASDCARIALTGKTQYDARLRDYCVALGISNIRIIKKIERLVHRVVPQLINFNSKVLDQAVQSLAVLGWCFFSKVGAPTIEFLRDKRQKDFIGLRKEAEVTDA